MSEQNFDFMRQDSLVFGLAESGATGSIFRNSDALFNTFKGDHKQVSWDRTGNIKYTFERNGSKTYLHREQQNIEEELLYCKQIREMAENNLPLPLAPLDPNADSPKLQFAWTHLPLVIRHEISDLYFGGLPWDTIKHDRTLKTQWYMVVQKEYPKWICYPGGKLPLDNIVKGVPYPTKSGETKYFQMN